MSVIRELLYNPSNGFLVRTLASHTSDEIGSQLTAFRDRERESQRKNNELQHMLLDVEAKLEKMKEQTRAGADAVS